MPVVNSFTPIDEFSKGDVMNKAMIFNIQKFCVHDGPGIRTTVFFKGCPLDCWWCHNPESQQFSREMLHNPGKCVNCGQCFRQCGQGAISIEAGTVGYDREKCVFCERCADFCLANAREIAGREYSVAELFREIAKDKPFYEQSGGGVTLSGGEALCQIDFVAELAAICKGNGIDVAIDTCGYVPFASFERLLEFTEVFLYDLKLMDPGLHKKYTGQDNGLILENLRKLSAAGAKINLRVPLIEGINTTEANINASIELIRDLNIAAVNLLPYHDIGESKYLRLNRAYLGKEFAAPSPEKLLEIQDMFAANRFSVKIGG